MANRPDSQAPVDKKSGNGSNATTPVVDTSVDTENPNDAIEVFNERVREQIPKG